MGIPKTDTIEPGTVPVSEMTIEEKFHYEQAHAALAMLSGSLNKGSQAVSNLKTYENSVNKIFKTK
jgi:hypothetical protein